MKRIAVLAVMLAVLAPSPALAHGTGGSSGGSGISLPLLLGGIALAAAALATRGKIVAAGACAVFAVGVALAGASLFAGGGNGSSRPDVHIAVVQPADGDTVPAGQPITIQVNVDGPLATGPQDSDGGHLHLSVDGQLQQMPYTASAEVTLELGRHDVTVEYVDNEHLSYDPRIENSIEVEAR